jgi:hypothetical protein
MAKSIANLSIQLSLNARGVVNGVKVTTGAFDKLEKEAKQTSAALLRMERVTKSIDTRIGGFAKNILATGAAFAAATISIAGMSRALTSVFSAMSRIDEIGKMASRINASTEALSGLTFAFEQIGITADSGLAALDRMVRRIGLAADNGGPAAKALEEMGFQMENLTRLSADAQFFAIIERLRQYDNAAVRAAKTTAIFGDDAKTMTSAVDAGAASLGVLIDEARALGVTFDEVDAAAVAEAADAMNRVKTAVAGLAQQVAIALSPSIQTISDDIAQMVVEWSKLFREDPEALRELFAGATEQASSMVQSLKEIAEQLQTIGNLTERIGKFWENTRSLRRLADSANVAFDTLLTGRAVRQTVVTGRERRGRIGTIDAANRQALGFLSRMVGLQQETNRRLEEGVVNVEPSPL